MDFFENLKATITKTAQSAAKKTNEVVESTKIKIAISDAENEIAKMMREMGETLYEAYKTGTESYSASLEEKCEAIDTKYSEIDLLESKLNIIRNMKSCPNCKKEMDKGAAFCSSCGEKF